MKANTKLTIEQISNNLYNKGEQLIALQDKLERLTDHVRVLEKGIERDLESIQKVGEIRIEETTPQEIQLQRLKENNEMLIEKLSLTKQILDGKSPAVWAYVQNCLPEHLRDKVGDGFN